MASIGSQRCGAATKGKETTNHTNRTNPAKGEPRRAYSPEYRPRNTRKEKERVEKCLRLRAGQLKGVRQVFLAVVPLLHRERSTERRSKRKFKSRNGIKSKIRMKIRAPRSNEIKNEPRAAKICSVCITGSLGMSLRRLMICWLGLLLFCGAAPRYSRGDEGDAKLREEATGTMRKAAEYYRGKVALRGGYVYYYSPDMTQRHGEGVATATQIWVQPPGTPTVGLAYLAAYKATGDKFYLDAAREAGEALIYGQLKSGGWQNCIDFDPKGRVNLYRNGKGGGQ